MTSEQLLEIIEELCINSDMNNPLIEHIYFITHAYYKNCPHFDWQKQIETIYKDKLKEN